MKLTVMPYTIDVPAGYRADMRRRAQRGAEWLDSVVPGWEAKVKVSELDLCCPHGCVLGQIAGVLQEGTDFWSLYMTGLTIDGVLVSVPKELRTSFALADHDWDALTDRAWPLLTEVWLDELTARGYGPVE